jgi:hypothetical protein
MKPAAETWFERRLWSYVPCHWKGVAVLFAIAGACLLTLGILWLLASVLKAPWVNYGSPAALLVLWALGLRIARRHSR